MSSSLASLAAKFKHTQMARILLTSPRFLIGERPDAVDLLIAVPALKEQECRALARMGREKMTLIMAHELVTYEEAEQLLSENPEAAESFKRKVEGGKYCFVRCDVTKRKDIMRW